MKIAIVGAGSRKRGAALRHDRARVRGARAWGQR